MKKLAIIGASYLQAPLIEEAKKMGLETHVFAWAANDVGERIADFFYPISIVEKDEILKKCQEIEIDGICSIASDLAAITVNYVAQNMGLCSNDMDSTYKSTNKHLMRECFEANGDPSPRSRMINKIDDLDFSDLRLPLIVKPLDRSGSRGISKVDNFERLPEAIERAKNEGFDKNVLIEEFAEGEEYSVEYLSFDGEHNFLNITKKYTTGAPGFVETGHIEPSGLDTQKQELVKKVVEHALDSIGLRYGASHSEIKIDGDDIKIIEIGGRMGGDFIGSDLVCLSTGYNFIGGVIETSLGIKPSVIKKDNGKNVAVRFIFNEKDVEVLKLLKQNNPELLVRYDIYGNLDDAVTDSSNRHGYFILSGDDRESVVKYLEM